MPNQVENPPDVVPATLRAATDSVGAAFLVHVGYNGAQMLIALVATHGFGAWTLKLQG